MEVDKQRCDAALAISLRHSGTQPTPVSEAISQKEPLPAVEAANTTVEMTTAMAGSCANSSIYNPYSDTCITLVKTAKSWPDAKSACEDEGEHLVTFDTLDSAFWFINLRKTNSDWKAARYIWVGGKKDNESVWRWEGKSTKPVALAPWGPGEPNNYGGNQGCMDSSKDEDYKFHDLDCSRRHPFACEY